MAAALDDCVILGIRTTAGFLGTSSNHPEFRAGRATTSFIGKYFPSWGTGEGEEDADGWRWPRPLSKPWRGRARAERGFGTGREERRRDALDDLGPLAGGGRDMSLVEFDFLVDGEPRKISVEVRDGTLVAREGGQVLETEVRRISANEIQFRLRRPVGQGLSRPGRRADIRVRRRPGSSSSPNSAPKPGRPGEGDEKAAEAGLRVRSPMPGKVTKVAVAEGEEVRKNQTLVIVEAMKMENEIKTAFDGVVTKIHVAVGDLVDSERPLIEVEKSKVPRRRSEP